MQKYFLTQRRKRKYLLFFGDLLWLIISVIISYTLRVYFNERTIQIEILASKISPWLLIVILLHIFSLYLVGQYNLNQIKFSTRSSIYIILSIFLASAFITGMFFFIPEYVFGRQVLLIHIFITSIILILWRTCFAIVSERKTLKPKLSIIGNYDMVKSFLNDFTNALKQYEISGICCYGEHIPNIKVNAPKEARIYNNLDDLIQSNDFDIIIFDTLNTDFSNEEVRKILGLKQKNKEVLDFSRLYENISGKIPLSYIDGRWLLHSESLQGIQNLYYTRLKRLIDITLSFILFIVFFPFFILIPVCIKLTSRGPVLFKQERLGQNRRKFICYKFRTMKVDSEDDNSPTFTKKNDERITKIGNILRTTRLDELPQLWNIIKAEMSFVGPRPIREVFALQISKEIPFYWLRYDIKPGVTGWAQVNGAFAVQGSVSAFEYELFYLQNMSILLDALVIVKTVRKMLRGGGGI